jgi:DNA repair exonuclease SbcCD nuclease subunit
VNTDGRYQKTFVIARKMIVRCIERLREIAPVKVLVVPGNHDTRATWHLGDSLECYFHRYDDVEIDNNPTPRKYFQHGNVMLMFTHGDKGKRTDYPLLMATEQRAMWGATKYRETHTGHTHMTKMDEQHGIRVRVLPALCPPDAWHSENGFVGNLRSAEGYVWNNVEGLVTQVFYNDDAFEPIETKVTIAA